MKKLERRLGLTSVIAISLSAMLGSGLFVLPGLAAAHTGPSVWMAYILAGICVLPAALSKAELATAMPTSGGTYVYIDRTFGPLAGTISGLGLWLSLLLKSAFALVGFGAYLTVLAPLPLKPTALGLLAAIVALNIFGVGKVGKVQALLVSMAIGGLVLISGMGVATFEPALLTPAFPKGGEGFLSAAAFVFISYAGVTKVAAVAEEVKDPDKNLPVGILVSLGVAAVLYGAVTLIMVGNIPMEELATDLHPVYTLALKAAGPSVALAAGVLGVLTMTSMANAGVLASSRFPFAMSRDDLLPRWLGTIHQRFVTPVNCIVVTALLMAVAILLFDVAKLAKLASSFKIMIFMTINLTVIVLRESDARWYKPSWHSPLYPWVQIAGIATCLVLLFTLGVTGLAAFSAIAVIGSVVYVLWGQKQTDRGGIFGRLGRRTERLVEQAITDDERAAPLPGESRVVVPILGHERSPETLVEVAASLAGNRGLSVPYIREVPDQTNLASVASDDVVVTSLRRRIEAMSDHGELDVRFEAVVTHDIAQAIHEIAHGVHGQWLVMAWRRQAGLGLLTSFSASGWLARHVGCNQAHFRDAGVRYFREILVLAEPGPHDVLVVTTADQLGQLYSARLTFARFVHDDDGASRLRSEADYLNQLSQLCASEHNTQIIRGQNETQAFIQATVAYDLLVMTAPAEMSRWRPQGASSHDLLISEAACSVLSLKTPRQRAHEAFDTQRASDGLEQSLDLKEFLDPRTLAARIEVGRKEALFTHMAEAFNPLLPSTNTKSLSDALWLREETQSTGMGDGVAFPHATVEGLDDTHLGIFTLKAPIPYGSLDQAPVDVVFVTVGPPSQRNTHLLLMAALSRLCLESPLLSELRKASGPKEILAAFRRCEE